MFSNYTCLSLVSHSICLYLFYYISQHAFCLSISFHPLTLSSHHPFRFFSPFLKYTFLSFLSFHICIPLINLAFCSFSPSLSLSSSSFPSSSSSSSSSYSASSSSVSTFFSSSDSVACYVGRHFLVFIRVSSVAYHLVFVCVA
ncbi:hypothetical protein E2C01_099650 [Portunus trituberculatus]|uniref:Uncharacterized protein n=1 Tax=Portunus trituberculatus TaxID=210409 RepID=A0A5B7KBG6_PORTR|nr:hypothetical protein [Portunus trituberculatus]